MKTQKVEHYTAFSHIPEGESSWVVLQADGLTDERMQEIARLIGYNETAFVCRSQVADSRLRDFTPGHEVALCGDVTIARIYALNMHRTRRWAQRSYARNAGRLDVRPPIGIVEANSQGRDTM